MGEYLGRLLEIRTTCQNRDAVFRHNTDDYDPVGVCKRERERIVPSANA